MFVAEYIWLDSNNEFRSKTRVTETITPWNYDGSSTGQATTEKSELILRPIFQCFNPMKYVANFECVLILCDVWENDHIPHESNSRMYAMEIMEHYKDTEPLFGLEQEFFIKLPKVSESNNNQYCKVNCDKGRRCMEEIFDKCLRAGLKVTGMNAEVAPYQWEIQVCDYGIKAADQLLIIRYILQTTLPQHDYELILHPKPFKHCNGSGCHINFSTNFIRNGTYDLEHIMGKFKKYHQEHLELYGEKNELRLTGTHETCSLCDFKWGKGDRTASIRCNVGYFEDRRPASNVDPYLATAKILETLMI